jgi:hypothetical protein
LLFAFKLIKTITMKFLNQLVLLVLAAFVVVESQVNVDGSRNLRAHDYSGDYSVDYSDDEGKGKGKGKGGSKGSKGKGGSKGSKGKGKGKGGSKGSKGKGKGKGGDDDYVSIIAYLCIYN